jgi:pimeloyl-ACP methyl ester carboxylesterase
MSSPSPSPVSVARRNSTNVRSKQSFALVSLLSTIAPSLASRLAERALFVPPRKPASVRGRQFLTTGVRDDVCVDGERVAMWRWDRRATQDRRDVVVCLHGWGGAASQFRSIVNGLAGAAASVVAFDAPGHGSSSGRKSSIVAMRDALIAVARRIDAPIAIVAHSGGSAAAALAMADGLPVERAVFIGPTADPAGWMARWAQDSGLSPHVLTRIRERTERDFGMSWSQLHMLPRAAERSQPLLVIHDRDDVEVPWTDGADLVDRWPGARLILTRGLGHRRILHDPVVASAAASFAALGAIEPHAARRPTTTI